MGERKENKKMTRADEILRSLKGKKPDFAAAEKVARDLGYSIVFFNTPYGDRELERYELTERKTENSFIYSETARIIFINGNISPDDKMYVIWHEIGHIAHKHICAGAVMTRNKILNELEANAFGYSAITHKTKQETAKKVLKATSGAVDFVSIEEYIKQFGYIVVLYNTSVGDEVLQRYSLKEKAERCKAFTLCGTGRIIFIDNNVSAEDKLNLLLHEVGHILSGHLGDGRICARNKIFMELEADAVAYALLNPKKLNKKALIFGAVGAVALGVGVYAFLKAKK